MREVNEKEMIRLCQRNGGDYYATILWGLIIW